jgi:hypothetical protein
LTISALNSAVNERRRRGFFPMLSVIGHTAIGGAGYLPPQQCRAGPNKAH